VRPRTALTATGGTAVSRQSRKGRRRRLRWVRPTGSVIFSSCPRKMRKRMGMADHAWGENGIVPFLRAGPPPDRTRVEGWRQWQERRSTFIPAPRLTAEEFAAMSPRRRALHDLHRTATHVNMGLLETPMSAKVTKLMRG